MKTPLTKVGELKAGSGSAVVGATARNAALRSSVEVAFERSLNPVMQETVETIKRVAASHVNVLITGESGTGKEWVAHMIHSSSPRAAGRLVTVECVALQPDELERELFGYETVKWREVDIRPGALEKSNEGTLLLNEIGHVPPVLLMRMARAIEFQTVRRISGEDDVVVNTRLIATMTLQPNAPAGASPISDELVHRLSPIQLELLPLRKRREDIPGLVEAFLDEIRGRTGSPPVQLSEEALLACVHFDWPGNLRHLRNAIEYAAVMSKNRTILPEHLPPHLSGNFRKG